MMNAMNVTTWSVSMMGLLPRGAVRGATRTPVVRPVAPLTRVGVAGR